MSVIPSRYAGVATVVITVLPFKGTPFKTTINTGTKNYCTCAKKRANLYINQGAKF